MGRLFLLILLCLTMASPGFGQGGQPAAVHSPGLQTISKTQGRQILEVISTVDAESETDCSHLVHDVYEQAGLPYEYASSFELYIGSANFTRVRAPQAGDLVVWRGHVGIVLNPKEHSFFSFVRSGPDTQFYDSSYWRARGVARFYRYLIEKAPRSSSALEAARSTDQEISPNRRASKVLNPGLAPVSGSGPVDSRIVETPPEIVLQAAGKTPGPAEVAAAFLAMNQTFGELLRTHSLNRPVKPIIVYRGVAVSAVQIKGNRGTALVRVESLGNLSDTQTNSPPYWKEQSLEFKKTKKGWVMSPPQETSYVSRGVALRILSARLADLTQDAGASPEREREQRKIIHFLNLLLPDESSVTSAESN